MKIFVSRCNIRLCKHGHDTYAVVLADGDKLVKCFKDGGGTGCRHDSENYIEICKRGTDKRVFAFAYLAYHRVFGRRLCFYAHVVTYKNLCVVVAEYSARTAQNSLACVKALDLIKTAKPFNYLSIYITH